jgi:hypothetical protein
MSRRHWTIAWAALLVLGGAGCHGSNATAPPADAGGAHPDADFSLCVGGDAAPYMAGTVTPSTSGAYLATLVSVQTTSSNGPPVDVPAVGLSTFSVTIADANGGVPVGLSVTADKPYMPLHRHYASVAPIVTATQAGTFDISNVSFFQPGDFEVTLHLQVAPAGGDGGDADGGDDGGADDGGGSTTALPAPTTDKFVLEICVPS